MPEHRHGRANLARLHLVLSAVVTVALLTFAYLLRETDRTLAGAVTTAAILHWLQEARATGREVARDKAAERHHAGTNGYVAGADE